MLAGELTPALAAQQILQTFLAADRTATEPLRRQKVERHSRERRSVT